MRNAILYMILLFAQAVFADEYDTLRLQTITDSVNASMKYQTGVIELNNGIGKMTIPAGFKYLDAEQSNYVITELWGNPKTSTSLGMLFPENAGPMTLDSWAFNIEYDAIGYVKDDDANEINYDDLLKEMQSDAEKANPERVKQGYQPVTIIGWASTPFYDKDQKALHWAKEIKFGEEELNTLNYNIRILGRKGVVILNAIATMNELSEVQKNINPMIAGVEFADGNKYADFNPDIDEIAAWTLGGLVTGKILAKVGLFALLLKFWKVIALGVAGIGGLVWKKFKGQKDEA